MLKDAVEAFFAVVQRIHDTKPSSHCRDHFIKFEYTVTRNNSPSLPYGWEKPKKPQLEDRLKPSPQMGSLTFEWSRLERITRPPGLTWCPWSHVLRPEKLYASVAVILIPVQVPNQWPLIPSVTSVNQSDYDKDDIELKPGAVHRYQYIHLQTEKSPRTLELGECLKAVRPVLLKWAPFPPNEVGRIAQQVREGERVNDATSPILVPNQIPLALSVTSDG